MKPKSLSATSIGTYENCPAMFKARYIDWAKDSSGFAADLGTVCHATLERWVKSGYQNGNPIGTDVDVMTSIYEEEYRRLFADDEFYADGWTMVTGWLIRTDFSGREILSTETKREFLIPTPDGGKLPVRFVMDRYDRLENGALEVVDYKTNRLAITGDQLSRRVQARVYALAAQLDYPDAEKVWVTFDFLRHEPVSVRFTKEQNRETWVYLKKLVARIWDDDGKTERLNPDCRYCVRRHACRSLRDHAKGMGVFTIDDPVEAARARHEIALNIKGLEVVLGELDEMLLQHLEVHDLLQFDAGDVVVSATAKGRRSVDPERAAEIIGPDLMRRYGNLTVSAVDAILKGDDLDDEQKSRLRLLVRKQFGAPSIKSEAK